MSATTGKPLAGADHLAQSVADILGTPLGTRVGRRDYGSDIPQLLDQPLNDRTRLALFAAGAIALLRLEPRLHATRITLEAGDTAAAGTAVLRIAGRRLDGPAPGTPVTLAIPVRATSAL